MPPPGRSGRSTPRPASCSRAPGTRRPSGPSASGAAAAHGSISTAIARFVSGPSVTSVSSPGRRRASSTISCGPNRLGSPGSGGSGGVRVPDARRPVGLGRDLERADERHGRPIATSMSRAPREREHGPGVAVGVGRGRRCRTGRSRPRSPPRARRRRRAARACRRSRCRRPGAAEIRSRATVRRPRPGRGPRARASPSGSDPDDVMASWKSRRTSTGTSAGATPARPRASQVARPDVEDLEAAR